MNRFADEESLNGSTQPKNPPSPTGTPCGRAGLTSEDLALLRRLQDIYAKGLATSEKGRAYLKERGITDPETIRAFGLDVVSRLCEQLRSQGAPGLHFYTMNQSVATLEICDRLGL